MKVLVIPEDPTYDQFIIKPILETMFGQLKMRARIKVLGDPRLRGIDEALDPDVLSRVIDANPMEDLFLLIIDRDCDRAHNTDRAGGRETDHPGKLIACLAIEEIEVWMLALHRGALKWSWKKIRSSCDPKEEFAEPFLRQLGWHGRLGGGRKLAMRDVGTRWRSLVALCGEIQSLQSKVSAWLEDREWTG